MDRTEAFDLVKQHLGNQNLIKHSLAVEACMREFAQKFSQDVEKWGLAGLLHDLDYDSTYQDPENHALKTAEMLEKYHLNDDIIHAIKAHNHKAEIKSQMDLALYTIDPTTGFITACALMHPSKSLEAVNLKRIKKRFKEKSFAKGANREQMMECIKLNIELDEFLTVCLAAMQKISSELGL